MFYLSMHVESYNFYVFFMFGRSFQNPLQFFDEQCLKNVIEAEILSENKEVKEGIKFFF